MINVVWAINDSFWDMGLPKYILNRAGECQNFQGLKWAHDLVGTSVGVIVIPGQHMTEKYRDLSDAAENFKRVVIVITGDEEAKFQADGVVHQNKKMWWFAPPFNPVQQVDRVAPFGWADGALEQIAELRKEEKRDRVFDVSFAGQVTHMRRVACFDAATKLRGNNLIFPTAGFSQGLARRDYYKVLLQSRYVLCPSGPCTPDSFRFAEALEAGCVPIVDGLSPNPNYPEGYWEYVCGENLPFPVVTDWTGLEEVIHGLEADFGFHQRRCSSWWATKKEVWTLRMQEDLCLI